jgi:tetratricopeptide (TPR) repeat protein
MGRVEEAIAVLQEALPLAVEAGDRETESVVLKNLGIALRNNSRPEESRGCLERLLAVARETGDRRSEASALGALGVGLWQQGELDEAETLISQHRNLARDDGDRRGEAVALGYLAGVRYRQGRYEEARANYEAQLEITRSIGDRRGEGTATVNLGMLESSMGLFASALDRLERGVVLSSESGLRSSVIHGLHSLARLLINLGALPAARRRFEELHRLSGETATKRFQGSAVAGLAWIAALDEREEEAAKGFAAAISMLEEAEDVSFASETRVAAGEASLLAGDTDAARMHLEAAITGASEANRLELLALAAAMLSSIGAHDGEAAVELMDSNRRLMDHMQRLSARWYLWKATEDRSQLEKAYGHLQHVINHVPPTFRDSLVAGVPVHKAVKEAFEATRPA